MACDVAMPLALFTPKAPTTGIYAALNSRMVILNCMLPYNTSLDDFLQVTKCSRAFYAASNLCDILPFWNEREMRSSEILLSDLLWLLGIRFRDRWREQLIKVIRGIQNMVKAGLSLQIDLSKSVLLYSQQLLKVGVNKLLPDAVGNIFYFCRSLADAKQISRTNQAFCIASKTLDVLEFWADKEMSLTDNVLSDRMFGLDIYLDWLYARAPLNDDSVMNIVGSAGNRDVEKRDLLKLLYMRCASTRSLTYIAAMKHDGVFHLFALLGLWCISFKESLHDVVPRWLHATDRELWKSDDYDSFRWWDNQQRFRRRLPRVRDMIDTARAWDDERTAKAWASEKSQILALFVEEHTLSIRAPHWKIPADLDKQFDPADLLTERSDFYKAAVGWARFVSFSEWRDSVAVDEALLMSCFESESDSDSALDSASSSDFGWKVHYRPKWKQHHTSYTMLIRHFAFLTLDLHAKIHEAQKKDESKPKGKGCRASIKRYSVLCQKSVFKVPESCEECCAEWHRRLQPVFSDPWFWTGVQSAAVALAPDTPCLVRKVLHNYGYAHSPRRVKNKFLRAVTNHTAISEEALESAVTTSHGSLALLANSIVDAQEKLKTRSLAKGSLE